MSKNILTGGYELRLEGSVKKVGQVVEENRMKIKKLERKVCN